MIRAQDSIYEQIFSIPLANEKYLIYAPLKKMAFIANPSLVSAIEEYRRKNAYPNSSVLTTCQTSAKGLSSSTDCLDFLFKLGFFKPASCPQDYYFEKGVLYDTVILFLTNQCNLRCSYFYA